MDLKTILYEKHDGIATITLNRPERGNSFSDEMLDEFPKMWAEVRRDRDVRVVVLTGAGKRHFCTGMDVKQAVERAASTGSVGVASVTGPNVGITSLHNEVWKPIVTAINGICAGGGFHFVVDSDINIFSANATFFEPHVSVAQVAVYEPIGLLARRVPMEWVLRMALLGRSETIDAQTAFRLGIVSEVVPQEQLMPRAYDLARRILENSPAAVTATKKAIWHALDVGYNQACRDGWELLTAQWKHPDNVEGPKAFAEKRKPRWSYE